MTVPEYLLRQDRRGGSFQLFKVLLSRWGGLQVKDLSGCLWKYLKTQVWICNITSPEKTEQGEEEAEMTASRVHVLSQVWGCVCFSSWNSWTENLQTFTSLLLIFLPGAFVISLFFPFFLIVVKTGSLDYISLSPRVFSALSVSFLWSMTDSQHELMSLNWWKHFLCVRSTQGGIGSENPTVMCFSLGILEK